MILTIISLSIISLILISVVTTLILLKIRTKYTKPEKPTKRKIKLDTDVEEFEEIKKFNRNEYIEETFNDVFHAIQLDEWSPIFNYGSFEFNKDNVKVKIEYSDYKKFKIKSITLTSRYTNYNYTNDLDESVYRFFYNIYSTNIKTDNERIKKATDDSLSEINKVLGKSTIRDRKIDQLLDGL
jgi:hypothetical protein